MRGTAADRVCARQRARHKGAGVGSERLRRLVFYPGGNAVWPQCWLCAVCAVGHVGCCVGGGVPYGGKHIIIAASPALAGGLLSYLSVCRSIYSYYMFVYIYIYVYIYICIYIYI